MNFINKNIKKVFPLILVLSLLVQALDPVPIIVEAKSIPSTDLLLYVGEKYGIDDNFSFHSAKGPNFISNPGKYIISNSNVVGIEGYYAKNRTTDQGWLQPDGFYSYIVGLHTGKSTITVLYGSQIIHKYNITVKHREVTSPTEYCRTDFFIDDNPITRLGREEEKEAIELESAVKNILISLKLENYNTDAERLFALAKWYNENTKRVGWADGGGEHKALVKKRADKRGLNMAGTLLLRNMGYEIAEGGYPYYEPFIYLYEKWYKFETARFPDWEFSNYTIEDCFIDENDTKIAYVEDTKLHLPSMLVNIETEQQNLILGQSKVLPEDRLSHNVYSSDPSVVDIKEGKIVTKGVGIAIVYRYDDTYCDAFYVIVEPEIKVNKKTVTLKKSGKMQKTFKSTSPYRSKINQDLKDTWLRELMINLDRLEPALSPDARFSTTYDIKTGLLSGCIMKADGSKEAVFNDNELAD